MENSKVVIAFPGHAPIHTTTDAMARAANRTRGNMSDNTGTKLAVDQLKSIVERIVKLEEEKKGLSEDIRDVYGEAKSNGYEVKALRYVVKVQKMDQSQKAAHDEVGSISETYMQALGML